MGHTGRFKSAQKKKQQRAAQAASSAAAGATADMAESAALGDEGAVRSSLGDSSAPGGIGEADDKEPNFWNLDNPVVFVAFCVGLFIALQVLLHG